MRPNFQLEAPGWTAATRQGLAELLRAGAGKRWPVAFDFDNSLVCGDIGEATLAVMVRDRLVSAERLPANLSPPIQLAGGQQITPSSAPDLTVYYEALLAPTVHGLKDPTPLSSGYVWAVEIMQGLTPWEVAHATQEAVKSSRPLVESAIIVTPGETAYPVPFFYPEMVELIAALIRQGFEIWIISASNVWSVRWMILRALNPRLRDLGVVEGIPADHVVGVATMMSDSRGQLYKDSVLVRENADYAAMDAGFLSSLRLTNRLQFPVPTYSGKVGCLWDLIGRRPFLAAGDSPGDHPMLSFSDHRLWIARLEKPAYQQSAIDLARGNGIKQWLIQPVLTQKAPGFIPEVQTVASRLKEVPSKVRESLAVLEQWTELTVISDQ